MRRRSSGLDTLVVYADQILALLLHRRESGTVLTHHWRRFSLPQPPSTRAISLRLRSSSIELAPRISFSLSVAKTYYLIWSVSNATRNRFPTNDSPPASNSLLLRYSSNINSIT